jgi:hypothetical protein
MDASGDLFDHLAVERRDVIGIARGDQPSIDRHLLIDPRRTRVPALEPDSVGPPEGGRDLLTTTALTGPKHSAELLADCQMTEQRV